jgi:flagellar biogenesis protein FliO
MKRQFSSWTSGLSRRSQGTLGGRAGPWAIFPSGRRSPSSLWAKSGIWIIAACIVILIILSITLFLLDPAFIHFLGNPSDVRIVAADSANSGDSLPSTNAAQFSAVHVIAALVWRLALLTAVCIILGKGFRYLRVRYVTSSPSIHSSSVLSVLDRVSLGRDHAIYTVDLGRRILIVGASGAGLTTLSVVEDADEVHDLRQSSGVPQPGIEQTRDDMGPGQHEDSGQASSEPIGVDHKNLASSPKNLVEASVIQSESNDA